MQREEGPKAAARPLGPESRSEKVISEVDYLQDKH